MKVLSINWTYPIFPSFVGSFRQWHQHQGLWSGSRSVGSRPIRHRSERVHTTTTGTSHWGRQIMIVIWTNLHIKGRTLHLKSVPSPTQGVTLFMSHFFEHNFYLYQVVVVWSVQYTIPVFHKQKGHTFYVALFGAKFLLICSCEGLDCQLDPKVHTFYVALF